MTEETVEERRERLKALREAQNLLSSSESGSQPTPPPTVLPPPSDESSLQPEQEHEDNEDAKQDMKFRNYLPRDKALQNSRIAPPALPKFEDPVAASAVAENAKEDPIVSIAPKKPNWDLHRAVEKKLEKLQRRTQKALIELMQEQLQPSSQIDAANATQIEGFDNMQEQ
eukprot:TRINITY_DN2010_c0_g1_i2.p1 TRINITY_DN2010_c0_g1~~TRINITY_DN2010_c0_g1_i2.p1  ORF type:complete len:170 (+),score=51.42 TRINITY_DN2010_c0_g1_i2:137-646(+)